MLTETKGLFEDSKNSALSKANEQNLNIWRHRRPIDDRSTRENVCIRLAIYCWLSQTRIVAS